MIDASDSDLLYETHDDLNYFRVHESRSMTNRVLYIFHRDLRLYDNTTWRAAVDYAKTHKLPLQAAFVFTKDQVTSKNKYKSMNSIQFMLESLEELDDALREHGGRLYYYKDNLHQAINLKECAVFETLDYTPFAKARQQKTADAAGIYFGVHDTYLTAPGTILNKSGKPFQKFTPFYNAAKEHTVEKPQTAPSYKGPWVERASHTSSLSDIKEWIHYTPNPELHVHGGRSNGIQLLKSIPKNYDEIRDIPAERTTDLSAHHHFGTLSIRETYWASSQTELRRQLYWRDFYGQITDSFELLYGVSPYEFQNGNPRGWRYDKAEFKAWCAGKTGVPIVDAAMNQLARTGYMHNRARLIVANYLVKSKGIYWRWGERWFAQHLVDYDFAQNFGNWCWVASVLPFSQAPFRSLDPERQTERFDADGRYQDRWLN